MAADIAALRELLVERFPGAVPVQAPHSPTLPTGVPALDRILPNGGLPRGRLTLWSPGGGATAILRSACSAVVAQGERAVWIEAGGSSSGADALAVEGWSPGVFVLRPSSEHFGLECAEELSRIPGFGLVVLSLGHLGRVESVRLSRAVREGGGALVLYSAGGLGAPLRLSSHFLPDRTRWCPGPLGGPAELESVTLRVDVEGLGVSSWTEIDIPVVEYEVRLSLEPRLVDRRGARP